MLDTSTGTVVLPIPDQYLALNCSVLEFLSVFGNSITEMALKIIGTGHSWGSTGKHVMPSYLYDHTH